jgi:hypothetical protein
MEHILTRNFKKIILLFTLISIANINSFGQAAEFNSPKINPNKKSKNLEFDPDRIVLGGNLGGNFGRITLVEIAPNIGYLFTDNYLAGFSLKYIYFEDKTYAPQYIYKTNIFGAGVFNQYFILEDFLLHAEYEFLNMESQLIDERLNIHSFFVGGGYKSSLGGNSYVSLILLYNLNETSDSPYTNPILRVGFGIGL